MITITVYGLDQYTVGRYSREHAKNLAQLFETNEDNISFIASDAYIFHNGVEQTSWNPIVKVNAPEKFKVFEAKIAKYLLETLKVFTINLFVEFSYFHEHHRYEHINKEYPRFLTEENVVNVEDSEDENDIFMGNVFEGMEEKLDEVYDEKEHCDCDCGDECCCDDECDCDDECECGEHECHCGHHHNN